MRTRQHFLAGFLTVAAAISTLALGAGAAVADSSEDNRGRWLPPVSSSLDRAAAGTERLAPPSEASSTRAPAAGRYTLLCAGGGCVT